MRFLPYTFLLSIWLFTIQCPTAFATELRNCRNISGPDITFIEFESKDISLNPGTATGIAENGPLTMKGKLSIPAAKACNRSSRDLPAVVILHGSSGVDSRGDFYARAMNSAGIATLEIDMWEARGIAGSADRPALPVINYPDAFAALSFLADQPNIDPDRIGVLGFSWGAVVSMASATENIAAQFGAGLRFKAHVANYPVCYAYNNPYIPFSQFGYFSFGSQASNPLTGAPVMIQIGDSDAYDESPAPCLALKASLPSDERQLIEVVPYSDAAHAWDRLMVPISVFDPFSHLGQQGYVDLIPNVEQAYASQKNVVRFFKRNL
ncbi:dienelactone hydrolase family protein [Methylomonas sp. MgM2]